MCEIAGVYTPDGNAALYTSLILHLSQNRGQDTAGIYTLDGPTVNYRKGLGRVKTVFGRVQLPHDDFLGAIDLSALVGKLAIGHLRYQTTELGGPYNAQPYFTKTERFVVGVSYNGHVNNAPEVNKQLRLEERIAKDAWIDKPAKPANDFRIDCDAIPIMYTFADGLEKHKDPIDGILQGAEDVMRTIRGGYAISAMVYDKQTQKGFLVAIKDPRTIRPAFFGKQNGNYAISSETFGLEQTKFWDIKPVKNAEVVIFYNGEVIRRQIAPFKNYEIAPCQFEDGYFSSALSTTLNGRSVNHGRFLEGMALARKIQQLRPEWTDITDFVTFLPSTPIPIAKGVAKGLKMDYRETIEKYKYDYQREFITLPGHRHEKTRMQSAVHWDAVCGRSFILVDDSIVRGETMKENIRMLREAGAVNIYVASGYPRVEYTCDLGVDMKTQKELIAHGRTDEQIAQEIGADGLIYLNQTEYEHIWNTVDIDAGIRRKIEKGIFSPEILEFVSKGKRCNACVTGKNPTH